MQRRLKRTLQKAKATADNAASQSNTKKAIRWTKQVGGVAKDKAIELGKDALNTDLGKATAAGAVIGAVVAVPLPLVGPVAGAVLGAGVGAYMHMRNGGRAPSHGESTPPTTTETLSDLKQLEELRRQGVITDEEFEVQKRKLLSRI